MIEKWRKILSGSGKGPDKLFSNSISCCVNFESRSVLPSPWDRAIGSRAGALACRPCCALSEHTLLMSFCVSRFPLLIRTLID